MKKNIDKSAILNEFRDQKGKYEKLGANLTQALELILHEEDIPYLSITYRVKDSNSFLKKIERKKYSNPFQEIEDICGIRIICYYQSDVEKICDILTRELNVSEDVNKVENMEFDRFGYRSHHIIAKIKDQWLSTPNYRGLEELKSEIQVRTVLMHAWAEIEHKLAYKSESQIPQEFKRRLSRISAKLEESDEQFEEIKKSIESNKKSILDAAKESQHFNSELEFNLDNLQAFLDYAFPDRGKDITSTTDLFDEMNNLNLSISNLVDGFEKTKTILRDVEIEESGLWADHLGVDQQMWIQVGAARSVLELTSDVYFEYRKGEMPDFDFDVLNKFREILKIS